MQYIRLNTNKKCINAIYNSNKIIIKYKNLLLRFGLVWFWKGNPKFDPIIAIFPKQHPNTSKHIWFFEVFGFFGLVCGFILDRFEFEHP